MAPWCRPVLDQVPIARRGARCQDRIPIRAAAVGRGGRDTVACRTEGRRRRRAALSGWVLAWCACAVVALGEPVPSQAQAAGTAAAEARPWRVVLFRSWDSLYRVDFVRESALRDALTEQTPRTVEFYPEETDPLRLPANLEGELVALLQHKYRQTPVDLVIASGKEPLEFVSRYRDAIWPGAT